MAARIDHSSRGVLPTVVRRCVWSRNLEYGEAKARHRAVKNTAKMGCNARKTTNKQTNKQQSVNEHDYSHAAKHRPPT